MDSNKKRWLSIFGLFVAISPISLSQTPATAAQPTYRLEMVREVDLTTTTLEQPGAVGALAFAPWGELLALELQGQRVLRFDNKGKLLEVAGGFGFDDGSTRGASDLTVAGFEIWISDPQAGRIVRHDRWFAALPPFSAVADGTETGAFERPVSVARASSGDIALLEKDRQELLLLDPEGRLVERVAGFGESATGLRDPHRVEVGPEGRIAVCDPGRQALLLLDRFGSNLRELRWPLPGKGPTGAGFSESHLWVCGEGGLVLYDDSGQEMMRWGTETTGGPVNDIAIHGNEVALSIGTTIRWMTLVELR